MAGPIIFDVILVVILALFALSGARKGFVLTFCSLLALVVCLICGNLVSSALAPKVADSLEPKWEAAIEETLEEALSANAEESLSAQERLEEMKAKGGLYAWTAQRLEIALENGVTQTAAQLAAAVTADLAELVARCGIFLVTFLLTSLAWTLLSHALNLVTRLPGIHGANQLLGLVLGGAKGLVVVYLLVWICCTLTGAIPEQTVEQTHLLLFLYSHSPMELLAMGSQLSGGSTAALAR